MLKIDAQKKCLLSAKLREEGKEWESVGAMREVFEPLIRRDDDELEVNDLFDLIAVAAYSAERAAQISNLIEIELSKMPPETQEKTRKQIAWMRGAAMCFLKIGLVL